MNTLFRVSVRVGFRLIQLPFGDHLSPFQKELGGENGIELPVDIGVLGLHCKSLKQIPEK